MPTSVRVRTPTLLQMEATECGAAALGIVLGYHGRFVPLAELRRECGVSRDGSKASKVIQAARRYGMIAKGYSKDNLDALRALPFPVIVFWQFNHFLVVEGINDRYVFLNDPANGHRRVTHAEFNYGFTGVVLTAVPGPEFQKGGQRPRLRQAIVDRLRGQSSALLFCFLAGLLLVLPNLALPVFTSVFVDNIILQGRTSWFRPLLTLMVFTLLLQMVLHGMQITFLRRLKLALSARLASQFFWHLLRLPLGFYVQRFPGEIAYRSNLNAKVVNTLTGQLAGTLIDVCTMGIYIVVLVYYDVWLTLIGICFAAINFVALRAVSSRRVEANMRLAQDQGMAASVAIAGLQSIETLKASGSENAFFGKWAGHYAKSSLAHQELEGSNLALGVLPGLLLMIATTLILVVGGFRVMSGALTVGMLIAFQGLMAAFLEPVGNLVRLGGTFQELEGDLTRLDDVLANPTEQTITDEGNRPRTHTSLRPVTRDEFFSVRLQGLIEISDLTFGYSVLEAPLIENFGVNVRPGQRVALVGGSGSGKSTIAKLMTGLYPPWKGEILFDGQLRSMIPPAILTNSVALVDQDIMLFQGTVRDNLTLWDRTVPEEALVRACRDAAIYDTVAALPGGLDATLQEGGSNLSGGQRQRLEIARALVNNPSVLVLDEATSALDAETERIIDENLRRRGCTCVVVAPRLSTIRDCDEIIVLERGQIVERGTHQELWDRGATYARLIKEDMSAES
ncbi:MAG: NHLP family bacteriocin export ABC transporter peptidase/permease/ATPase subunit [Gemmataceae bacterium]|nr:NHLP family bacteriocin export ABC transporter peptidase/permease/ATPase subunit [Gemmataceae bacterium]